MNPCRIQKSAMSLCLMKMFGFHRNNGLTRTNNIDQCLHRGRHQNHYRRRCNMRLRTLFVHLTSTLRYQIRIHCSLQTMLHQNRSQNPQLGHGNHILENCLRMRHQHRRTRRKTQKTQTKTDVFSSPSSFPIIIMLLKNKILSQGHFSIMLIFFRFSVILAVVMNNQRRIIKWYL